MAPVGEKAAAALALVIQELSTVDGYIDLTCRCDGGTFHMVWREVDGPPLTHEPSRKGFGS
jgi:two-component sensor histidine kinase